MSIPSITACLRTVASSNLERIKAVIIMDRVLSPMSTINANAIAPDTVERRNQGLRSFELSPAKSISHRDVENVPEGRLYERSSSPCLAEATFNMDDTHFSAFSAVPNQDMTQFAQMRQSPQRKSPTKSRPQTPHNGELTQSTVFQTPRSSRRNHSQEDHSPSPTPRRPKSRHEGDTTNLLLDFTEQINGFYQPHPKSSTRRTSPLKSSRTQPDLASYTADLRTPSPKKHNRNQMANLLDLDDIPSVDPLPTPRSRPSITDRQHEALKSQFQAEVTSLKATLSGKEAEVASLKHSVSDAERRVGEALEELREGRNRIEDLEAQKLEWEKRDKEMQDVCRSVKQEIMHSEQERETLEKSLHDAESRAIEAESKLSVDTNSVGTTDPAANPDEPNISTPAQGPAAGSAEVDAAVNRVAQELHALYKNKHETKVKALKKSYEARWERKLQDLSTQVSDLTKENEDLKLGRDATMTGVVPGGLASQASAQSPKSPSKRASTFTEDFAKASEMLKEEHAAAMASLNAQLETSKADREALASQLEGSRQEMAELVAATEEMINLQAEQSILMQQAPAPSEEEQSVPRSAQRIRNPSFSRSVSGGAPGASAAGGSSGMTPRSRPLSGAPSNGGAGESRIGRGGFGARSFGRSGIMNNIERMGRGRVQD